MIQAVAELFDANISFSILQGPVIEVKCGKNGNTTPEIELFNPNGNHYDVIEPKSKLARKSKIGLRTW